MLNENDPAPDFDLPDSQGKRLALGSLKGRSVVVYFYPKDDTEGCTIEAKEFSERMEEFESAGVVVIGVSPDSPKSHEKFRCKHELAVRLVSDEDKLAADAYGVWIEKSMYGRKFMGVERSTFLIAADGTIARIWRKVSPKGHAADVLGVVKGNAAAKPKRRR